MLGCFSLEYAKRLDIKGFEAINWILNTDNYTYGN